MAGLGRHTHWRRRALSPARRFILLVALLLTACQPTGIPETSPGDRPGADRPQPLAATPVATATPFQPVPSTPTFLPTVAATSTVPPSPTLPPRLTLLFTGVITPARCVQAAIDAHENADYLYAEVRPLLQDADLTVGTLNAALSDYPPHTGCIRTFVLVGGTSNAGALARAGFGVMSVATNHIKNCGIGDCGNRAFFDTLAALRQAGIEPVGAGKDLGEAMQPIVMTLKGVRFAIVSLGMVEPMAFAGQDTPGIAPLTADNARQAIAAARQVADVVIAMPHWGPEDTPDPNEFQIPLAHLLVQAGADLVVGNHTHVVQAIQTIAGTPVFYGLGNFVFDQTWDLAHQQGVILKVTFEGTHYVGYELIPTHVDGDGTVHLASTNEAAEVLKRIEAASAKLKP